MKIYTGDEIEKTLITQEDEWVRADVAQGLYDALKKLTAECHLSPDLFAIAEKALIEADGE